MGSASQGSSNAQSTQLDRTNQNQTRTLYSQLPPGFQNILDIGLGSLFSGLTSTPNLGQLARMYPLQGTASLTPTQLGDIQALQQGIGPSPSVQAALSGLQKFHGADLSKPNAAYESFLGSQGKPSQATTAALKEFSDLQAPEILQQAALMGQGSSGAALNALSTGQERALVPFMQQDLTDTLTAAGGLSSNDLNNAQLQLSALSSLGGLGLQQEGQQLANTEAALTGAGMQQQNAQDVLNHLFNQQQGTFNFASGLQTSPQQWFENLVKSVENLTGGSTASSTSTSHGSQSQPKF